MKKIYEVIVKGYYPNEYGIFEELVNTTLFSSKEEAMFKYDGLINRKMKAGERSYSVKVVQVICEDTVAPEKISMESIENAVNRLTEAYVE